jgi:ferredoxin-NADP reductase
MRFIDRFLNNITMYRLLVYVLAIYAGVAFLFSLTGVISMSPVSLISSLVVLMGSAYVVDRSLGRVFSVPTNMETAPISSLILFLIMQPAHSVSSGLLLALVGAISSASKFLIAWKGRHIFNPAALAAAIASFSGMGFATWWIGSSVFWPVTLALGLAVVRKTRRFSLLLTFLAVSVALEALTATFGAQPFGMVLKQALLSSPLIFLATIMLTEPATMPPRRYLQLVYAVLVAALFVTAPRFGPLIVYPEVALLLGNLYAYSVSPRFRVRLRLAEIRQISDKVREYVFKPDRRFEFMAGQYMEWTLPGVKFDSRGNRRTFTIASSPTEDVVRLGMKFYDPPSKFKAAMQRLKPGDIIYGSQLAGSFTLHGTAGRKLAFVAGGIGVTPFRSMVRYLVDNEIHADIVLLYVVRDPQELAFMDVFKQAAAAGVRTIPVVTDETITSSDFVTARFDTGLLQKLVPDFDERLFYVSGPNAMVDDIRHNLHQIGVARTRIKADFFSGY